MKSNPLNGREIKEYYGFPFIDEAPYNYYQSKAYSSISSYIQSFNEPATVLFIAEKPSIAKIIANSLCRKRYQVTGPPYHKLYQFTSTFFGRPAEIYVGSVHGHIYNKDFPKVIREGKWDSIHPKKLFDSSTINLDIPRRNVSATKFITEAARYVDALVLWLDYDNEGENICFEVINIAQHVMATNIILRAHFSSLAPSDIQNAYKELQSECYKPNLNISLSVNARQIIDLKVGIAFTRLLTNFLGKQHSIISYGPCQIPTLGFIVKRYNKIKTTKIKSYFTLQGQLKQGTRIKWDSKIEAKSDLPVMSKYIKFAGIETVEVNAKRVYALNTVEMLRLVVGQLKISSEEVMKIAESLYTKGLITYPRTETSKYSNSESEEFEKKIEFLNHHQVYEKYSAKLLKNNFVPPNDGVNKMDHPPITPNIIPNFENKLKELDQKDYEVYQLIVAHFLASLSPTYTYIVKKANFKMNSNNLYAKEIQEKTLGYAELMPWIRKKAKQKLPDFEDDKEYEANIECAKVKDKPITLLSEIDLIHKMDKHKIGTDASIPVHINNVIRRGYVNSRIENNVRILEPTPLGAGLIRGLNEIDESLVLPKVRAGIEEMVNKIAVGSAKFDEVIDQALNYFKKAFDNLEKNLGKVEIYLNQPQ
jgi:DNA topoisomerase III